MALAAVLGLFVGATFGWNLSLAAVLLAATLCNVPKRVFAGVSGISIVAALAAGDRLRRLGELLLDDVGFGSLVARLGNHPLVALLDWDRYVVVGRIAVALLLAPPLARAAAIWAQGSWLAMDPLHRPRGRWLRPRGLLAAGGLVVAIAAIALLAGPRLLARNLLAELSLANRATVTAARWTLSPWSGVLEAEDVRVPDPQNLGCDRIRIQSVTARLDLATLIRGRLHAESIELQGIRRNVPRESPAEFCGNCSPANHLPANSGDALPTDAVEVHGHLRHWSQLPARLVALREVICAADRIYDLEPLTMAQAADIVFAQSDLRAQKPARSALGGAAARVHLERVRVTAFAEEWGWGNDATLELCGLNSIPALVTEAARMIVQAPRWSAELVVALATPKALGQHAISLRAGNLPLVEIVESTGTHSRLVVQRGLVSLNGSGWIDHHRICVPLQVDLQQASLQVVGDEPGLGLNPAAWNKGLQTLGGMQAEVTLTGTWLQPVAYAMPTEVVSRFKHQLRSAGEHGVVAQIDAAGNNPTTVAEATPPATLEHVPTVREVTPPVSYPNTGMPELKLRRRQLPPAVTEPPTVAEPPTVPPAVATAPPTVPPAVATAPPAMPEPSLPAAPPTVAVAEPPAAAAPMIAPPAAIVEPATSGPQVTPAPPDTALPAVTEPQPVVAGRVNVLRSPEGVAADASRPMPSPAPTVVRPPAGVVAVASDFEQRRGAAGNLFGPPPRAPLANAAAADARRAATLRQPVMDEPLPGPIDLEVGRDDGNALAASQRATPKFTTVKPDPWYTQLSKSISTGAASLWPFKNGQRGQTQLPLATGAPPRWTDSPALEARRPEPLGPTRR